jgi:hypothetical protein
MQLVIFRKVVLDSGELGGAAAPRWNLFADLGIRKKVADAAVELGDD